MLFRSHPPTQTRKVISLYLFICLSFVLSLSLPPSDSLIYRATHTHTHTHTYNNSVTTLTPAWFPVSMACAIQGRHPWRGGNGDRRRLLPSAMPRVSNQSVVIKTLSLAEPSGPGRRNDYASRVYWEGGLGPPLRANRGQAYRYT